MNSQPKKQRVEFGDFQTPAHLAAEVCDLLVRTGVSPSFVVEPTCGQGAFLAAALDSFPTASVCGYEYNPKYVEAARELLASNSRATVRAGNFFKLDWEAELSGISGTLLVLGNPPWVTNSTVGSLGGDNLPKKGNIDGLRGIDALTGRANFDISEWMLRENLRWLRSRTGTIAVLCKTSVARKVLVHGWSAKIPITSASIYRLDASRDFGVSVDACLLLVQVTPGGRADGCYVYDDLNACAPASRFGVRDGRLISDIETYERLSFLCSEGLVGWRSGVKHDCSRVFELSIEKRKLVNGLGEAVSLEADVVFPFLKSSDVAHGRPPRKHVLITHRSMDESPHELQRRAPSAWQYLSSHAAVIQARGSSIYKKRPPFSIFGIGPYSFAPWKVAISGLYKQLRFSKIGPIDGRPVLLDDTCYFFPCNDEEECAQLYELASSSTAIEFWSSLVFWDAKRPITAKLLNLLNLSALSKALDAWTSATRRLAEGQITPYTGGAQQARLFREPL
jgi:hypothetical protein